MTSYSIVSLWSDNHNETMKIIMIDNEHFMRGHWMNTLKKTMMMVLTTLTT